MRWWWVGSQFEGTVETQDWQDEAEIEEGEQTTHLEVISPIIKELEGTARYAGFTSSSCGGFRPAGKKRAFYVLLDYFRPFLVFSSNLSNF